MAIVANGTNTVKCELKSGRYNFSGVEVADCKRWGGVPEKILTLYNSPMAILDYYEPPRPPNRPWIIPLLLLVGTGVMVYWGGVKEADEIRQIKQGVQNGRVSPATSPAPK